MRYDYIRLVKFKIMKNPIGILIALLLMTAVYACKSDHPTTAKSNKQVENPVERKDEKSIKTEAKSSEKIDAKVGSSPAAGKKGSRKGGLPAKTFLVKDGMINTIKAGMVIVTNKKKLVYGYVDTGGEKIKVYRLMDDKGGPMGYVTPRLGNTVVVGDITLTSSKAKTELGIRVGDSFRQLVDAATDIIINGSEPSGKTYATVDGVAYKLDATHFTKEVDASKIKPDTRIMEIVLLDKK